MTYDDCDFGGGATGGVLDGGVCAPPLDPLEPGPPNPWLVSMPSLLWTTVLK